MLREKIRVAIGSLILIGSFLIYIFSNMNIEEAYHQPESPISISRKHIRDSIEKLEEKANDQVPSGENISRPTRDSAILESPKDKKSEKPSRISCDNLSSYSRTEIKNFCDKEKNYSCGNCKVTCYNFHDRSPEDQIKYCQYIIDNNKIPCDKCRNKSTNTASPSTDTSPTEVCNELVGKEGELRNLCKAKKYISCPNCNKK